MERKREGARGPCGERSKPAAACGSPIRRSCAAGWTVPEIRYPVRDESWSLAWRDNGRVSALRKGASTTASGREASEGDGESLVPATSVSSLWDDSREAGIESCSSRFELDDSIDTIESIVEIDMREPGRKDPVLIRVRFSTGDQTVIWVVIFI